MNPLNIISSGLIDSVGNALDKLFTTNEELESIKLEQAKLQSSIYLAQIEVNKIESANTNLFVAGWRPAIGWICALGLFYQYLLYPIIGGFITQLKSLEIEQIMSLLFGLLGLGGLRTLEKVKNVEHHR